MKAYIIVRKFCIASILFFTFFLGACSTRYLSENQKLVRKVTIKGVDKEFSGQANLYIQRSIIPNGLINFVWLYNLFNTKNGKYRTDRIKNIGEAPTILDSAMVEVSRREIEKFLFDKGFFRAKVSSDIVVKKKKAFITFQAQPGPSFKIRNFAYNIPDSSVKALYVANRSLFTKITEGARYDGDSLRNESKQIFNMLQRRGYFDYREQYVKFSVDTNLHASAANVTMSLDNPADARNHQVYTLSDVSVLIKNSSGKTENIIPDTAVVDTNYFIKDYSKRFKPKAIFRYNYLKEGDLYDIDKKNLTYDRLFDLNVFKSVKIDFSKTTDSLKLDASIEAVPMKRLSNRVEGEFTFNSGRQGFNLGNTYTNRNVFGGGEQLDFRVRYGLLFDKSLTGSIADRILNKDLQFGVNLTFPRLIVPFNTAKLGRVAIPHTTISTSMQIFDQLEAFRSRVIINSLTYDWAETRTKLHSLTPFNVEYRNGVLTESFKSDLRAKEGYELYIRTNDRQYVNLGSLYTFTLNTVKLLTYENFVYFRSSNDFGGNTLNLINKLFKNDNRFLGLNYLQYGKTEADLRVYRSLGRERQFIFRINPGFAYPKPGTELPFEKNFFAGGSTGIRAWQARTLGPGNYNRQVLDSSLRRNLTSLDQLGEIKFEGNLEYRFTIANNFFGSKLKGATFTDFGNIWRIRKTEFNPGGEFKFNRFFNQIAIGSGAGLRYDVEYFVFRIDIGIKIKDPQFEGSEQWVIKNLFNKDFKDRYKITHSPDRYHFLQPSIGIGMPF